MINWNTSKKDNELCHQIADRAVSLAAAHDLKYKKMDAVMDIEACHLNGNPLKLNELLHADDFNFVHDVFGIRANINRETGTLQNCFLPRYSK